MARLKNLILSYATHSKYAELKTFFASARRACAAADVDIVVIVNAMGREYAELADEYAVQLFPANSIWREIRDAPRMKAFYRLVLGLVSRFEGHPLVFGDSKVAGAVHRVVAHPWIYAQAQRFLSFEDFLSVRCNYDMILLSDARDVVFQGDPFVGLDAGKLHVALQSPREIFGGDNIDSRWVREILGEHTLESLRGKLSSCCGTVIGGHAILMTYLAALNRMILDHKYNAIEQPMHNELVYLKLPDAQIRLHENGAGPFVTLGGMDASELELTERGLRVQGRSIPIVHMYDRMPETRALFGRLYG